MELHYYKNWWLLSFKGLVLLILGVLAFVFPIGVIIAFAFYIGVLLIVFGLLQVVTAFTNNEKSQWGWIMATGLFDLVLGLALIFYPVISAMALAVLTGFWAIFIGLLQLVAFFSVRKVHAGTWWLILLTGGLAILFGMFLIWSPFIGLLTVTFLLGIEAILIGLMTLIYSLRLRKITSASGDSQNGFTP